MQRENFFVSRLGIWSVEFQYSVLTTGVAGSY